MLKYSKSRPFLSSICLNLGNYSSIFFYKEFIMKRYYVPALSIYEVF
jgi:hypothetical protein